ncbi:uncharacterized protein [Diabrotica undecimpunctata]|uniref:uncharacterized protein n=1 Tax=Diabrotica undecimpunctata TaxID=50387 RepID=UPI003B63A0EE
MVLLYKDKGDIQDCRNCKFNVAHNENLGENCRTKVKDKEVKETSVGEEQFGFMPGRRITDALFALRRLIEKYSEKKRELHLILIYLEKAYDKVSKQELWRCTRGFLSST